MRNGDELDSGDLGEDPSQTSELSHPVEARAVHWQICS